MYKLFFEDFFMLLGYGLFLAVPLYVMAFHFRQRRLWIACGVITAILVAALVVEWYVITPKEEVEKKVVQLARIVEQNDLEELLKHISKSKQQVVMKAGQEMPMYDFSVLNLMTFHEVKVDEDDPRKATADFMVRFNVTMEGYKGGGFRDVFLKFEKEDDDVWRIVEYAHYDPTNRPDRQGLFF